MSFSINTILLIAIVGASFLAWNNSTIFQKWLMIPYQVKHAKQWYRFITSGFIHSDYIHLGFNAFVLYSFGSLVEQIYSRSYLGSFGYLLLFLVGVIVADIPTYLKHKDNPSYSALGASGGVSAIVFASILLFPNVPLSLIIIPFFELPGFIFGIMYLIYSHFMSKRSIDNINHDAHLYGSLFGIVFTLLTIKGAFKDYFLYGPFGIMHWDGLF